MTPNNVGWMNESNKYVETIKFITKIYVLQMVMVISDRYFGTAELLYGIL